MKIRPLVAVLCGAALAVALAGCSSSGGESARPTSASSATSTGNATTSAQAVGSDCGQAELDQGERDVPEYACLLAAVDAGRSATLVVVRPTVEGDRIRITYTVKPGGLVEIREDTREDKFGPKSVTVQVCPARKVLSATPSIVGCTPKVPVPNTGEPTATGTSATS